MPDLNQAQALRLYLEAQIELGEKEVFFDEPWEIPRVEKAVPSLPKIAPNASTPPTKPSIVTNEVPKAPISVQANLINTNSVKPPEFLKASNLIEFNAALMKDPIYAGTAPFILGEGGHKPSVMLVFASPIVGELAPKGIWNTSVGVMIERMFNGLNIEKKQCYFTYFYKKQALRPISSLIEVQLRNMLAKEAQLVEPEVIVLFGEKTLQFVFGRVTNLNQDAGKPMSFAGFDTTALLDPYHLMNDKNLKLLTWNVHIPASGFFVKA